MECHFCPPLWGNEDHYHLYLAPCPSCPVGRQIRSPFPAAERVGELESQHAESLKRQVCSLFTVVTNAITIVTTRDQSWTKYFSFSDQSITFDWLVIILATPNFNTIAWLWRSSQFQYYLSKRRIINFRCCNSISLKFLLLKLQLQY